MKAPTVRCALIRGGVAPMYSHLFKFTFVLCFLQSGFLFAKTLEGKVVRVTDGDTITVLDATNTQTKIRLTGIDAPEKKQPFGNKAKEQLSNFVAGRNVTVDYKTKDKYKRVLGKVLVKGQDINLEMLKSGLAWHYKHFEKQQTAEDRVLYSDSETTARTNKLGLWVQKKPVAPWDFRKVRKAVSRK